MNPSAKVLAFLLLLASVPAVAWADGDRASGRNAAHKFATLPEGVRFPEGIAANPANGDIYVATFDFSAPNKLLRYNRNGSLIAERDFGSEPLLGLAFRDGHVYIANAGSNSVSVVDVTTRKEIAQIPVGQVPKRNITAILP